VRFQDIRTRIAHALSTARGISIEDDLRPYERVVREIRALDLRGTSDAGLAELAGAARSRIRAGGEEERELPLVFAIAAEASRRRLGLAPFDAQLIAGIAMHRGKLAQMQTGEGKTLAAVFPACLAALSGKGVHVLTANDYLARRDGEWMRPVYEQLGVRVASITAVSAAEERRAAYLAEVTYCAAREPGFDYLRDQLCCAAADQVHRGLAMAIVDEADSILVDEARVPLVIAGEGEADAADIRLVDRVARSLVPGRHYEADREGRRISLSQEGHQRIEHELNVEGIHEEAGARSFARVHAALHARALLSRDVDYVVKAGRIEPVDEFTGRIAERRQWPWGIQAALEAKEDLAIRPEGRVYGSITMQHFIGLYERLAAMTATAVPSADELAGFYGLSTVIVPPVKPVARIDEPDVVFGTRAEKMKAVVQEITRAHATGRPVLVGTVSVRESQELADLLGQADIPCAVLNAKQDEQEAQVIARAGRLGAVTISTNMAGRGTDIKLEEGGEVHALGGLYVIGTNRHESRRIDDQLRGRAGRQGEPGSSRFFISLEDPLFERYGVREFLPAGVDLSDPRVLREIDRAQLIIEAQHHRIRDALRAYSRLVELDRRHVRELRDAALRDAAIGGDDPRGGELPPAIEKAGGHAGSDPRLRPMLVQAFLCRLDQFWADHLLLVEEVREGIGLERFAGRDPGLEYIRRVGSAFDAGLAEVERAIVEACERAGKDPGALSLEALGISRPSSTWTYQVDELEPIRFDLASVARRFRGIFGGS
jgi:preprotein translocase subunit SecA